MNKPRVLFLCTGNTARSQMAEAFLRHYAGDRFEVHSAGLEPGEIHPLTYQAMAEKGYDLAGQRSKALQEYFMQMHFGYLITVCERAEARCPIFPGVGQRLFWGFDDPAAFAGTPEAQLEKFREVRDQIEARVQAWVKSFEMGVQLT